jgi:hypothetical protein
VKSIRIPKNVEFLDGPSLIGLKSVSIDSENVHFSVDGNAVYDYSGRRLIRVFDCDSLFVVPPRVEVIGDRCFWGCRSIREVLFEEDSELKVIWQYAFLDSSVKSIRIPKNVEILEAFSLLDLNSVSIDSENVHFSADGNAVYDYSGRRLIRVLDCGTRFVVPRRVEIIGKECFWDCRSIREVLFEEDSDLKLIENRAFSYSSVKSIIIPARTEVQGELGCEVTRMRAGKE